MTDYKFMTLPKVFYIFLLFLIFLFITYPHIFKYPTTTTASLIVAGGFSEYDSVAGKGLVRIKQKDGSIFGLDVEKSQQPPFDSGSGANYSITTIAANKTEDVFLIGGGFTSYNGDEANRIVAVDRTGSRLKNFNSGMGFDAIVQVIKRSPWNPGAYFVGGEFTSYNGNPAPGIAIITDTGGIYPNMFGAGVQYTADNNPPRVLTIDFHEKKGIVCVGGSFSQFNNKEHNNIACFKMPWANQEINDFKSAIGKTVSDSYDLSLGFFQMPADSSEFSPVEGYADEVDHIIIDDENDKVYLSGQFNVYASKDSQGQFNPQGVVTVGNLCRLNIDGSYDKSYPYEGILAKRMDFVLDDESDAIIIGAGRYGEGVKTNYASLIKIHQETNELIPGFMVTVTPDPTEPTQPIDPGVHSKVIKHGTADWDEYIYLLNGRGKFDSGGYGYSLYNLVPHAPILRIHKDTGIIDPTFDFRKINSKEATTFLVLKEHDYGLYDFAIDYAKKIFGWWD